MGSLFSRKFDPSTDLVDLKGKVVIVTGGNTGIGFATVQHLARAGAKVYLAARDESRATGAIAKLEAEGLGPGNGEVVWLKLNLSDPREAKKAAEEFLTRERRLDVLVNNAAIMSKPYEAGTDGVSDMAVVNYISPFVFTRTLLPILEETARETDSDVRVVNVTTVVHSFVPKVAEFKDITDLNVKYEGKFFSGLLRYAHSKLLVNLCTKSLQRRFSSADPPVPITFLAIHPGGVDTFSSKWPFPKFWGALVGLAIAQPPEGAFTSVFAAASKTVRDNKELYRGAYLESKPTGRIAKSSQDALNEQLGDQLWRTTEEFLDQIGV